jgi:hypothetical protein
MCQVRVVVLSCLYLDYYYAYIFTHSTATAGALGTIFCVPAGVLCSAGIAYCIGLGPLVSDLLVAFLLITAHGSVLMCQVRPVDTIGSFYNDSTHVTGPSVSALLGALFCGAIVMTIK